MKKNDVIENLSTVYAEKYAEARLKTVVFDHYTDPYMVFSDFFGISSIEEHLYSLKKMYKCAISLKRIKVAPADVIFDRELISTMLNAAWIIDQTGVRFSQIKQRAHYSGRIGDALDNEKINAFLNVSEVNDPYLGIRNAFIGIDLGKFHTALNEWLKMSLCKNEFEEDYQGRRKLYKAIVKVLICCWLIYEREMVLPKVL